MPDKLIIDEEIRKLIPPLEQGEREQLEANLKRDGCRDEVVGWKGHGVLLDGHNRYEICERLGIGYKVRWLEFADRNAAIIWVIQNQFGRRNLNDFQRAELALKLKATVADEAESRMKAGAAQPCSQLTTGSKTVEKLGEIAGVSPSTIQRAEKIQKQAAPEIADMTRKGKVSIDAAAKVSTLPEPEQKRIAAAGPKAVKEKAKQIREGAAEKEPDVLDGCGVAVDGKLKQVFADAQRFDEAINHLNQIARLLAPLLAGDGERLEAGIHLETPLVKKNVRELRGLLKNARPYAPCGSASCGPKCPGCLGKKWLPASKWHQLSEKEKRSIGRGGK